MSARTLRRIAAVASTGLIAATATSPGAAVPGSVPAIHGKAKTYDHVLLLSVDGMHQRDLRWYVTHHPRSALASLVRHGTEFTHARTPFPSDSFPGLVGQVTGGHPRTTGIYYDVTYNHRLLDPTASSAAVPNKADCANGTHGANVTYDESLDKNPDRLDAGQGLPRLPGDILQMTGHPQSLIDPTKLPINPVTCTRVYPHQYLRVNTIFEVARRHGLRTAWSDKHPAYEILNGPSGHGVQDLFTPEVASIADSQGDSWTDVNSLTQRYDHFKVEAVLNEIAGYDHSGSTRVGTPGIFGMNFQSVSTAEKLPISGGHPGGYLHHGTRPGPVLRDALGYVDSEIAAMITTLKRTGQYGDTALALSAKHGQSPMERHALTRIDDSAVIAQLNSAWANTHPNAPQPLVAASLDDDGMLLWFSNGDRTRAADAFATHFLNHYNGNGTGNDGRAKATGINAHPKAYTAAGLRDVRAGAAAARFIGVPPPNPRIPDLIGFVQHGVVYTDSTHKIAEHGGNDPQDRHVPLIVSAKGLLHAVHRAPVQTTQVAPTILALLGLKASALQAVRIEHTAALHVR
ncbi:MAG: alkaline phosphatase family protein [Nocardioidaceae bacterium]